MQATIIVGEGRVFDKQYYLAQSVLTKEREKLHLFIGI